MYKESRNLEGHYEKRIMSVELLLIKAFCI